MEEDEQNVVEYICNQLAIQLPIKSTFPPVRHSYQMKVPKSKTLYEQSYVPTKKESSIIISLQNDFFLSLLLLSNCSHCSRSSL